MEILSQVSNAQFMFTAAAVAVVLVCAALVFVFGFRSAEQPQFDKLPLVLDDRKSSNKKNKKKDKVSPKQYVMRSRRCHLCVLILFLTFMHMLVYYREFYN